MSDAPTIRERIARATAYFQRHEAVVLTTFNLNGDFLETQALAHVLGIDGVGTPAARAELHEKLAVTPCAVYYDPAIPPHLSGKYRCSVRPVPLRGRFFHPKLVVIAGTDAEERSWVYVAVSSANLTRSAWGRNSESFGEAWIHTPQQEQSHGALRGFLRWLQQRVPLGDADDPRDAVARVIEVLDRLPDRRRHADEDGAPWVDTLHARLYFSVLQEGGLAPFLLEGRTRRPTELWAYSPYWSDVAAQAGRFGARSTCLVPAVRLHDGKLGLSRSEADALGDDVQVFRNPHEDGARHWHMKGYWLDLEGATVSAVGSCNFTHAGLAGTGGNAEAMVVYRDVDDIFPEGDLADRDALAPEPEPEEGVPEPVPVEIVVAWDWLARCYRWWLHPGQTQADFRLTLPGLEPVETSAGTHRLEGHPPPPRGASFTLHYRNDAGHQKWSGALVELHLEHSTRSYGRALSAAEILESWRGNTPGWDLGGGGGGGDGDGEDGTDSGSEPEPVFASVNLYDLYRATRGLRVRLAATDDQDVRHALLVGRPNSAVAMVTLAERDTGPVPVRFLVLKELDGLLHDWKGDVDSTHLKRVRKLARAARRASEKALRDELGPDAQRAGDMLEWFERKLRRLDREADA